MSVTTFCHGGNCGDICWSLPTVIDICRRHGTKAKFLLKCGQPATYAPGIKHPLGNTSLSEEYARKLLPLLREQTYIVEADIWAGEPLDYNLDLFRHTGFDLGRGSILRWYCYAFTCTPDPCQQWLHADPDTKYKDRVVINRTNRYRNPAISYKFLREMNPVFVGLADEHQDLGFGEFIKVEDYLGLARMIAGCRAFVGNQSFAFSLAEALKVPRVLEVCTACPNVIPCGHNAYDAIGQLGFTAAVEQLLA